MRILLLLSLIACTKEKPSSGDAFKEFIAKAISMNLSTVLECENKGEVLLSVEKVFGINKSVDGTFIAEKLCSPIVKSIVPLVLKAGVPVEWGCKLDQASVSIDTIINNICEKN